MASVLCGALCDITRAACEGARIVCNALGTALCLPCRACGFVSDQLGDVLCSPYSLFLLLALGFNLPPLVFGIMAARSPKNGGCESLSQWLVKNGIFCAMNIAAAIYIVCRILAEKQTNNNRSNRTLEDSWYVSMSSRKNSYARVRQVLCDDPGVAVYILVLIVFIVWTSIGASRLDNDDGCTDIIKQHAQVALSCNVFYLWCGGLAFCCSASC